MSDGYEDCGWVIEKIEPDEFQPEYRYFRPGHSGNKFYGPVAGCWPLSKAKIYQTKNSAIAKCVEIGSKKFRVRKVAISLGDFVYPPSQTKKNGVKDD